MEDLSSSYSVPCNEVRNRVEAYGVKFIKSWLHKSGGKNRTRIIYVCKCGREAEADLSNFYKVQNCRECGKDKKRGEKCWMWNPDREAVANSKRFRKSCEQFIRRAMKKTGLEKTDKTYTMLGYTAFELQEHIFNHPDMPALSGKEWHIDHIIPIQAFLDHGITDLKIINALSNLRPMEKMANIAKGAKYHGEFFTSSQTTYGAGHF